MGENEEDKFANATERPRHRVEINYELAICRYPITQGEFYAFDRSLISQPLSSGSGCELAASG